VARRPDRIGAIAPPTEDRVQARLVAIAADHIRRFGPERVTVVAVAREAGMSHANVYRFFASKAGLIEAVVVAWARTVELQLGDIANAPDPADDKLERFLTGLGQGAARGPRPRSADLFHLRGPLAGAAGFDHGAPGAAARLPRLHRR
jgi:AcrR family transcriptional regulator